MACSEMTLRRTFKAVAVLAAMAVAVPDIRLSAAASDVADAAMRGDLVAVRALVARKADVNAPQGDGATALHCAEYRGRPDLVEALLQAGANPKAANRDGSAALWLAREHGDAAEVRPRR